MAPEAIARESEKLKAALEHAHHPTLAMVLVHLTGQTDFLSERFLAQYEPIDGDPNGILGQAEIIIAKQRSGPTGEVKLHWFQQFTRFKNAEQKHYDEFEQYAADDDF